MNAWMSTAGEVIRLATGSHDSAMEESAVVMLGLLVLLLVMKAFTAASGAGDSGWLRRLFAVFIMLSITVGSVVAVISLVAPQIHSTLLSKAAIFGIPFAALLLVGIPLMGLILRTRYPVTLVSATASMFACLVAMIVTTAVMNSFHGSNREFSQVRRRTRSIDQFIGNP